MIIRKPANKFKSKKCDRLARKMDTKDDKMKLLMVRKTDQKMATKKQGKILKLKKILMWMILIKTS